MSKSFVASVSLLLGLAIGAILGFRAAKPSVVPAVIYTYKAPIRQADDSLVSEQKPVDKLEEAPHKIPKGFKEQRRVEVTVKPKQDGCAPIQITASVVEKENISRVVVSAQNGTVLEAIDLPAVRVFADQPKRVWTVGVMVSSDLSRGVWIERDFGRVRVGVDLQADRASARAGWNF